MEPAELIGFARRLDPGLAGRDLSRAAARLATLPEVAFTGLGVLRPQDVPRVRERFADWPEAARNTGHAQPGRQQERPGPGRKADDRPAPHREGPESPPLPVRPPRGRADSHRRQRAGHAREEPGGVIRPAAPSPAPGVPDRQASPGRERDITRRGRERGAGRDEPEIGR